VGGFAATKTNKRNPEYSPTPGFSVVFWRLCRQNTTEKEFLKDEK
jgi:hypothetical protein